jgi:hypothetical protein
MSCEFIDNTAAAVMGKQQQQQQLKQLDERDELASGSVDLSVVDLAPPVRAAVRSLGYSSLNKVDYLRKSFLESNQSSQCSSTDAVGVAGAAGVPGIAIVKSVKFKDPPENVSVIFSFFLYLTILY